ncbi:hypothetical protein LACDD01_00672 [Lactococcus sp. DD01]|nr:hypothetical protein LACDD01_00672 [Lactococcus sp. DD01]
MEDAARAIQGSYYYAIHVDSELINVSAERFSHEDQASADLEELLDRIRAGSDGNASPQFPAPIRDFTFGRMSGTARRIFTVDSPGEPQEFRYLENMEGGYHWIIRNSILPNTSWYGQDDRMDTWFDEELSPELRALVAPVAESFSTGDVHQYNFAIPEIGGLRVSATLLSVTNLSDFPEVAADRTRVVSEAEGGIPRAFALSIADVQYLTFGTSSGFANNMPDRAAAAPSPINIWWLRTPASHPTGPEGNSAWAILGGGFAAASGFTRSQTMPILGARPSLIIHQ